MNTSAVQTLPDHLLWILNGTTVDAIRSVRGGTADQIRAVWDYRAHGMTIDQAHAYIVSHCRRGSWRNCPQARGIDTTVQPGRIAAMAAERRRLRDQIAEYARQSVGPAAWLAARLTWALPAVSLALPDSRVLRTVRHESVDWGDRRNAAWPEHRQVTYETTVHDPARPRDRTATVSHDLRGDWRSRVLQSLGLADCRDRGLMTVRLHPACTLAREHDLADGTRIYRRSLLGLPVDVVATTPDRGVAFHAATVAEAVAGLARKQRRAEAAARGELLTAAAAEDRWGFCRAGLAEFAAAAGLDMDGEYTVEEVKAACTPEVRARFGRDLAVAGI